MRLSSILLSLALTTAGPAVQSAELRGTGDLGLVVERASGSLTAVNTTARSAVGKITGLRDLSHASLVYSPDERYAFVFGRDGALTKVDVLENRIVKRVEQAHNSVGGAISQDGRLIATSNYDPGGVRVFSAEMLEKVADIKAEYGNGQLAKVVGLVDAPGQILCTSHGRGDVELIGSRAQRRRHRLVGVVEQFGVVGHVGVHR